MMEESNMSKTQLARALHIASLLDRKDIGVSLKNIVKAAAVLCGQIRVQV